MSHRIAAMVFAEIKLKRKVDWKMSPRGYNSFFGVLDIHNLYVQKPLDSLAPPQAAL